MKNGQNDSWRAKRVQARISKRRRNSSQSPFCASDVFQPPANHVRKRLVLFPALLHNRGSGTYSYSLRPGEAGSRCPFRWAVFHRRYVDEDLLPSDLSCAFAQAFKHRVLSVGRGGGGSGAQALPAMPSGDVAGHAGVAGNVGQRVARIEINRRGRAGRRGRGRLGGTTRTRVETSASNVSAAPGSHSSGRRADAAGSFRKKADR